MFGYNRYVINEHSFFLSLNLLEDEDESLYALANGKNK